MFCKRKADHNFAVEGRKEHWSDSKANSIYLPSLTLPIVKAVVDFAIIERRVNPTCSFLATPPDLQNWTLTKDLLGRNRTIFQYPVAPEMALDLCHAALFLEIPALLDVSCRMLGYFIDFLPTVEGIDPSLMHNILSHVAPLKLAILECLPQYMSYYDQLTSVWEQSCAAKQLDYQEMDVTRSWHRYDRFGLPLPSSDSYTPREIFVHHELQRDLGRLATQYKIQKDIDDANRGANRGATAASMYWTLDSDGTWKRMIAPSSSNSADIETRTKVECPTLDVNPDGTTSVGALANLSELERHVPCVSICFPLESSFLVTLQHLQTLELRNAALCDQLVSALPRVSSLRHLVIDSVTVSGDNNEMCHSIYNSFEPMRNTFRVPSGWGAELAAQNFSRDSVPHSTHSNLFSALFLLQTAASLPFLESFQFSNIEFEGILGLCAWDFVFAPHWRQTSSYFFPSLKQLSLFGSGITANALSVVLDIFADAPLELLDIASNHISLCSSSINWTPLSDWPELKHLLMGHNNMRSNDRFGPFNIGKSIPPTLQTLGLDSLTWDSVNSFASGLTGAGALNIKQIYMHNSSGAPELLEALTNFGGVLCESLELLDLTLSKIMDQSINNIERIISRASHLRELRLCASNFTAPGLERLVAYLSFEEYSHIKVSWSGVTVKFEAMFPRLRRV